MALQDKYKELTHAATAAGVTDLKVREQDGVLYIDGVAPSGAVKDQLWNIYGKIDPDMRAGDLMLNIEAADFDEMYVIQKGDTLGKIAKHYGTTWQKIHEMNKDTIKNPDLIFPGQKIKVPKS